MTRRDRMGHGRGTDPARLPQRSRKYGVGKEIGGAVYVHRRYEHVFGSAVEEAKKHVPPDFSYTVVKLTVANKSLSFIAVADFDTAPEPTIGTVITVRADGSCRRMRALENPYIHHHKWLFVRDDYEGFDVEESKGRSRMWMKLQDVDRRRIGRKSYWQTEVVPRLQDEFG